MPSVRHRPRLYKQMSLEVGVRNPERYYEILKTFSKFEGQNLNDECILNIYAQLYLDGVITANDLSEKDINSEYLKKYIKKTKSHNNEWGFPTGYQAAFTRYLKTLSEFGFIYSQYNEPFLLSSISRAVISEKITLSEAFAIQSFKFWRKSPYKRVLNDFNFFEFIYNILFKLREKNKQLSYPQFMMALFSDDGDVDNFIEFINKNHVGNDLDKVYKLLKKKYSEIDEYHGKIVKQSTAFNDYGNAVFRVLQLTGFVNIDYSGVILISINKNREELLKKFQNIRFIVSEEAKESEKEYFKAVGELSNEYLDLINMYREKEDLSTCDYNTKISHILDKYNLNKESIKNYLLDILKSDTDRKVFWYMQKPIKFEFLLTLFLYTCYGNEFEYKPNFKCDDLGIPYSHAPGNIGDIELKNSSTYWLIEATLIRNKNQQINNETINLFRHIDTSYDNEKYLTLVAPYIHEDTVLMFKVATVISMFENKTFKLYSKAESVSEFVEDAMQNKNLSSAKDFSIGYIKEIRNFLETGGQFLDLSK